MYLGEDGRRLARLTLDKHRRTCIQCPSCTFWELGTVRRQRPRRPCPQRPRRSPGFFTRADWSGVLRAGAYIDGEPGRYVL